MQYDTEGERGMTVWDIVRLNSPRHERQDVYLYRRSSTATQMADCLVRAYEGLMTLQGMEAEGETK